MSKIVNFLKLFVLPKSMAKVRLMSVLISLFIFVLSAYLLAIPYGFQAAKSTALYRDDYNFLALQEIPDEATINQIFVEINDLECFASPEFKLSCTGLDAGEVVTKEISFITNGEDYATPVTKKIHFIVENNGEEDSSFDPLTDFDLEHYPYEDNVEHYFVLLTNYYMYYQAHQRGLGELEKKHNDISLTEISTTLFYEGYIPTFKLSSSSPETDGYLMGTYIIDQIIVGLAAYARSTAFMNTILICILFPLLMILIFWLFFKRNGRLTQFREYFNIAALGSVVPLVITFGVSWIFPQILNAYIFLFSIYYLFILYRINNSPTDL
ncbi:MAG: hypothetical protein AB7V00_00355 [Bacilli bacterium]